LKAGELVLLISSDNSYLVEVRREKLHTQDGIFDLSQLLKRRIGGKIKTHLGKEYTIVKPNIADILEKKVRRAPQIIMPKDIGLIIAYTGIQPGSLIVDAGTGSGFLSIFLASYIKPGKVVTYERKKRFLEIARENIKVSGLSRYIKLKLKDVRKGIDEKNVDMVTLDMKDAEKVVKHAYKALKPGGWLVVYSPYIEQVKSVVEEIKKKAFCSLKVVENIVREWQVERSTRPKTIGLMHSGWLTFARKIK